jgi:hypothetical protein
MAKVRHVARRTKIPALKVLYLLVVTAVTFMAPAFAETRPARWFVVPALLVLQVLMLLACRVGTSEIVRRAWRLKWLFVFLIGAYSLLPPEMPSSHEAFIDLHIPAVEWTLSINLTGLEQAGLMCLQIITLLLASSLVRLTGTGRDLVEGLEVFRLPRLFVYSLDHTLELLGGAPRGSGRGAGRNETKRRSGLFAVLRQVLRGDIDGLIQSIQEDIALADVRTGGAADRNLDARLAHDVAVVSGIALCMASFKMLRVLPGVPFASGHKTLLLFPLYILASRLTHSRWGATAAGSIMGVIGFLQGDGRFGVLEMLKHLAPGLVIDFAEPLVRRLPRWALGYCLLGLAAAVARTTTEFVLVAMLGARAEVYIFPLAKLIPNLVAGFFSGFATVFVLRTFERNTPPLAVVTAQDTYASSGEPSECRDVPSRPREAGQAAGEKSRRSAATLAAFSSDPE